MTRGVTYFEKGERFETHNMKIREVVKVLVKKEGKPFQVIVFNQRSGKIMEPKYVY